MTLIAATDQATRSLRVRMRPALGLRPARATARCARATAARTASRDRAHRLQRALEQDRSRGAPMAENRCVVKRRPGARRRVVRQVDPDAASPARPAAAAPNELHGNGKAVIGRPLVLQDRGRGVPTWRPQDASTQWPAAHRHDRTTTGPARSVNASCGRRRPRAARRRASTTAAQALRQPAASKPRLEPCVAARRRSRYSRHASTQRTPAACR